MIYPAINFISATSCSLYFKMLHSYGLLSFVSQIRVIHPVTTVCRCFYPSWMQSRIRLCFPWSYGSLPFPRAHIQPFKITLFVHKMDIQPLAQKEAWWVGRGLQRPVALIVRWHVAASRKKSVLGAVDIVLISWNIEYLVPPGQWFPCHVFPNA